MKWRDSALVCLASNCDNHLPEQTCNRRIGRNLEKIKQPMIVSTYNRGMGGVDVIDKLLGAYRPVIRGKKWWYPLFTNALNISVVAAWRLYGYLHNQPGGAIVSHLDFRRTIALCLMKMVARGRRHSPGFVAELPADIRFDGLGHENSSASQGRCIVCGTNTRNQCRKCAVRLHYAKEKKCFRSYHDK